jgi:hypothetical protein
LTTTTFFGCGFPREMTKSSHIPIIAVVITTILSWNVGAQDEIPSVRLPDFPTASSPMTPAVTAPSNAEVPTVTVPAPMVVLPTPTGTAPTVILDLPTGAPTTINIDAPTVTITVPSSNMTAVAPAVVTSTITPTTTFQPTTTAFPAFPTVSPFPTISFFPTFEICNICTNGTISSNDILPFEIGNLTCVQASEAGLSGLISTSNCDVIQQLVSENNFCSCLSDIPTIAPSPLAYEQCNICGDGFIVTNIEGKLQPFNSTESPLSCGFVDKGGTNGLLELSICAHYTRQASNTSNPCGCMKDLTTPSPAGTSAPTTEFTQCFVCGNETERVTALDTIIELPEEIYATIRDGANASLFTCKFIEESGRLNNSYDRLVCAFLQMAVTDVCGCQVIEATVSPMMAPSPASLPLPSLTNTNNTSSAPSVRWSAVVMMILPLFYGVYTHL